MIQSKRGLSYVFFCSSEQMFAYEAKVLEKIVRRFHRLCYLSFELAFAQ